MNDKSIKKSGELITIRSLLQQYGFNTNYLPSDTERFPLYLPRKINGYAKAVLRDMVFARNKKRKQLPSLIRLDIAIYSIY